MVNQENSILADRKRKFFLVLPLFLIPMACVFFNAFGGGKGSGDKTQKVAGTTGFNQELPMARLKDSKDQNKMSFYEQADRDSASMREKKNNDPYFGKYPVGQDRAGNGSSGGLQAIKDNLLKAHPELESSVNDSGIGAAGDGNGTASENAAKVYKKIAELNQALNAQQTATGRQLAGGQSADPTGPMGGAAEADRLEHMLSEMKAASATQQDSKMQQMNGMLDKIIAIQNPPSKDSLLRLSQRNKGKTYPVSASSNLTGDDDIGVFHAFDVRSARDTAFYHGDSVLPVRFYDMVDAHDATANQNVITASVDEMQTLVSGADIRMRLTSDMYVAGILIPAGTPITGTASLGGERLKVTISSISFQTSIYPVNLSVYDVDGVAGIYIPGSINRDVSKESADQAMGEINIMSLDQSVGAQAANAGIQAAKTLVSRKIRLVRVTIKDGYQVFLKDAGTN